MSNSLTIDTRHGKMSIKYPNDYISRQLINSGEYEWYIVRLIAGLCHNITSGIVLDVGANVGTITLPIARMFPNLHVHSFEVQPAVISVLKENIALNNLTNVTVHEHALGDYNGYLDIQQFDYNNADNIGAFSLNPEVWQHSPGAKGHGETFTTEIRQIDDVEFDQPIQCIKLDVEGFELNVLKGAVKTLEQHNYPPIVYELWLYNRWWDSSRQQINDFLTGLGYHITCHDDTAVAVKPR